MVDCGVVPRHRDAKHNKGERGWGLAAHGTLGNDEAVMNLKATTVRTTVRQVLTREPRSETSMKNARRARLEIANIAKTTF